MFLAAAGARALLTDLPHITPLTRDNVAANCGGGAGGSGAAGAPLVVDFAWGEPAGALRERAAAAAAASGASWWRQRLQQTPQGLPDLQPDQRPDGGLSDHERGIMTFDLIVAADVLYEPRGHAPLLQSLQELSSPHTQVSRALRFSVNVPTHVEGRPGGACPTSARPPIRTPAPSAPADYNVARLYPLRPKRLPGPSLEPASSHSVTERFRAPGIHAHTHPPCRT
jgi:hypothetical protein